MSRTCISVIVPCFNSGKYLSSCLDSLLNQDFDESYNIILIDCKSEGKEKEIGTRYQAQHPGKIYYYRYEKNDGPSLSRNLGLRHANGAFITFVDGDDYVQKNYLSSLFRHIRKKDADIATGGYYIDNGKKTFKGYSRTSFTSRGTKALNKYRHSPFRKLRTFCWGRLYKTEFLKKSRILFDPSQVKYEDLVFFFSTRLRADKVTYFKEPIYYYRQHESSIRSSANNYYIDHLMAFEKAKKLTTLYAPYRGKRLFRKRHLARKLQLDFDAKETAKRNPSLSLRSIRKERKQQEKKIFSYKGIQG